MRSAGRRVGDGQEKSPRSESTDRGYQLANLDAEAAFIARDNPAAAARVVEAIATRVELLAQYAAWGRPGPPRTRRGHPRVGGPRYSVPGSLPRVRPRCRNPPRLPWRPQVAEEALTAFGSRTAPSLFARWQARFPLNPKSDTFCL